MSEETIIFRGSPSILTRSGALFVGGMVLAAGVAFGIATKNQPPWPYVCFGIAAVALIYLLGVILVVKATQYEVTSERIRLRRGIVTKRTDELELYRANDTSLIEPLSLRMFGLGTIEIRTADASTPVLYLYAVHGARALRESLRKSIEDCRDKKRVRVTEFDQPDPSAAGGPVT